MITRSLVHVVAATGLGILIALWWRLSDQGAMEAAGPAAPQAATPSPDGPASGPERQGVARPLWRVLDEGSAPALPPYSASWSEAGRLLVDVTATSREAPAWRVGERLAVEVPQLGGVRQWTVEHIDEGHDARSRSVRGWVDGDGQRWRIVVTVGPGRVLAYIDTPQGPVELTGNARLTWLVPSSSMMAGIDFSQPDYILPERQGRVDETR